jgi:hypothetical protein
MLRRPFRLGEGPTRAPQGLSLPYRALDRVDYAATLARLGFYDWLAGPLPDLSPAQADQDEADRLCRAFGINPCFPLAGVSPPPGSGHGDIGAPATALAAD